MYIQFYIIYLLFLSSPKFESCTINYVEICLNYQTLQTDYFGEGLVLNVFVLY